MHNFRLWPKHEPSVVMEPFLENMDAWRFWVRVAERRPLSYLVWTGRHCEHLQRRTSGWKKPKPAPAPTPVPVASRKPKQTPFVDAPRREVLRQLLLSSRVA